MACCVLDTDSEPDIPGCCSIIGTAPHGPMAHPMTHENVMLHLLVAIGVGIGVGIDFDIECDCDPDPDSDPELKLSYFRNSSSWALWHTR
jgi:hypothetical protein